MMTPPQRVTATEAELKTFDWLPLEKWSVDNILNYYAVEGKQICKICDEGVSVSDKRDHVKAHVAARKRLREKERAEALERAREARRLKTEERKKERENS